MRKIFSIKAILAVLMVITVQNVCPISSIVYNLRISQTTKRFAFDSHLLNNSLSATFYSQFRKTYSDVYLRTLGILGTYIYLKPSYYLRVDAAGGNIKRTSCLLDQSQNQCDDVLFSGGYSFTPLEKVRITCSGLFGVPTHSDRSLIEPQFGYGHIGLGAQLDAAFLLTNNGHNLIRSAMRYIYFFKRDTTYEGQLYTFTASNLIDLFFAYDHKWKTQRVEFGYNPTFAFKAQIKPFFQPIINQTNFIRSNFFGSYRYAFEVTQHPSSITAALSYGFDHKPKTTGYARMVTAWCSWDIQF